MAEHERYGPGRSGSGRIGERDRGGAVGTETRSTGATGGSTEPLASEAAERAKRVASEQQGWLAAELDQAACALRDAGERFDGERQAWLGRVAGGAADALQSASRALREEDVRHLASRVEGFARTHPLTFLGGAAALGFLTMRVIKGGTPGRAELQGEVGSGRSELGHDPGHELGAVPSFAAGESRLYGPSGEVLGRSATAGVSGSSAAGGLIGGSSTGTGGSNRGQIGRSAPGGVGGASGLAGASGYGGSASGGFGGSSGAGGSSSPSPLGGAGSSGAGGSSSSGFGGGQSSGIGGSASTGIGGSTIAGGGTARKPDDEHKEVR